MDNSLWYSEAPSTASSLELLYTDQIISLRNEDVLANYSESTDFPMFIDLGPKRDPLYIVIPMTIIYALIFFTGVVGNVSTCIVIARNKSMHTATNYYLFSLAVSDLLLLVSGLPQEVYSIWSRYPYIFGDVFCVLRGLFAETSANATVLTITAFTVERYVAICHPFLSHTMSKLSRAVKLILVIWLVAICCAIPQALQFGVDQLYQNDTERVVCHVKRMIIEHSFELSTFLFFVSPMTMITVLYVLIGLRLRHSNMMKRNSTESAKNWNQRSTKRTSSGRHQHGQSSRRVLKMLVAVVVAFFICWAPFHAQRLVAIYVTPTQEPHKLKIYEIVTYISGILYYLETTVNPVLYHIMSNKFREAFKETFSRCCGTRRTQRSYSVLSRSGVQRGAAESTDSNHSCRDEPSIQTTLTQKYSLDTMSVRQHSTRRYSNRRGCDLQESTSPPRYLNNGLMRMTSVGSCDSPAYDDQQEYRVSLANQLNESKSTSNAERLVMRVSATSNHQRPPARFWRFFRCIAKRGFNERKQFADSPLKEPRLTLELEKPLNTESFTMVPCQISNSSLTQVEQGALEDELTTYMEEIHRRERNS